MTIEELQQQERNKKIDEYRSKWLKPQTLKPQTNAEKTEQVLREKGLLESGGGQRLLEQARDLDEIIALGSNVIQKDEDQNGNIPSSVAK